MNDNAKLIFAAAEGTAPSQPMVVLIDDSLDEFGVSSIEIATNKHFDNLEDDQKVDFLTTAILNLAERLAGDGGLSGEQDAQLRLMLDNIDVFGGETVE